MGSSQLLVRDPDALNFEPLLRIHIAKPWRALTAAQGWTPGIPTFGFHWPSQLNAHRTTNHGRLAINPRVAIPFG
jgi:hypothetical protein